MTKIADLPEFAAGRQFPVGYQFVTVQLDPGLHKAELLARQLAGQHVAFGDAQRGTLVHERITPVGEQLVTQALALLLQTERELLDALSEGERQILSELLHKVACARPR